MSWFSTKGQILQVAIAALGLILAGLKVYPEMQRAGFFSTTAILFYVLVVVVCILVVVNIKHHARYKIALSKSGLAFRMLSEECEFFLRVYRQIKFDNPESCRYPLNSSSWPTFNPPTTWTSTQISLCNLAARLDWFIIVSRKAFEEAGWKDYVEIFQLNRQQATIVELEAALEAFKNFLKTKIASLPPRLK